MKGDVELCENDYARVDYDRKGTTNKESKYYNRTIRTLM